MKILALFFIIMLGSHVSSADAKLHLQQREHMLKISWVSYWRPGNEKIPISCWWTLFINTPLNTPACELLGFKSALSLIYGEIEFFVSLLLLRYFHWDVFLEPRRDPLPPVLAGDMKNFL